MARKIYKVSFLKKELVTTEVAQARFDSIEEGQVIYNQNRSKHYVFSKKYEWRCAWSDKTLAHMQLPTYWFVNEIGDVISVSYSNRPVYVTHNSDNKTNYPQYHFTMPNGQLKALTVHNLVGLVFKVPTMQEALYLLYTKGLKAYGTRKEDANGHHVDDDITNTHWSNIEIDIKRPHNDVHKKRYDRITHNAAVPTVVYTPYRFDKDGNFIEHDGHNMLREPSPEELSGILNSVVALDEMLIEIGDKKYIRKFQTVAQTQEQ